MDVASRAARRSLEGLAMLRDAQGSVRVDEAMHVRRDALGEAITVHQRLDGVRVDLRGRHAGLLLLRALSRRVRATNESAAVFGVGAGRFVLAVATFEHRHDAAAAADVGDLQNLRRRPREVLRLQVHAADGRCVRLVATVANVARGRVEAHRQQNEIGVKGAQRGQQAVGDGVAVGLAAVQLLLQRHSATQGDR